MSSSSSPSDSRHTRKRRSRSSRFLRWAASFWKEWRVEILIAILVCLAVFLLLEQMNIRQSLYVWLVNLADRVGNLVAGAFQGLVRFSHNTTLSDLTAYLLLLVVLGLVIWRVRHRLLTLPRFAELQCPICGSGLARIHRRWSDRALSLLVPVRRYQCTNRECAWRGRRVYHSTRRGRRDRAGG